MIRLALVSLLIAVSYAPESFANKACSSALSGNAFYQTDAEGVSVEKTTERFTGYLGSLFESDALRVDALVDLKNQLESGSSELSIFSEAAGIVDEVHRDELQKYLDQKQFNDSKVIAWLEQAIDHSRRSSSEQSKVRGETILPIELPIFHPIKSGGFWAGAPEGIEQAMEMHKGGKSFSEIFESVEKVRRVELSHDFEVMQAPVSTEQWYDLIVVSQKLVGVEGLSSGNSFIGMNSVPYGEIPMVSVSWWAAILYANKLSELNGLKPVYKIILKRGSTIEGLLADGSIEFSKPAVLMIDAPNGDIYQAEGYRLPTVDESAFLFRQRGKLGNLEAVIATLAEVTKKRGYEQRNSVWPIYSEPPVLIDGNPFYDLYGNIYEWLFDVEKDKDLTIKGLRELLEDSLLHEWEIRKKFRGLSTVKTEHSLNQTLRSMWGANRAHTLDKKKGVIVHKVPDQRIDRAVSGLTFRFFSDKKEVFILSDNYEDFQIDGGKRVGFRLVRSLPNSDEVSE